MNKRMKRAPSDYTQEAKDFWRYHLKEWQEWDKHELIRLDEICRLLMDIRKDEDFLKKNGGVFTDRYGQPKEAPQSVRLRANRMLLMRMIREMGLDLQVPEDSRPPRRY
jgi:phage terminase small subunit